MKELFFDDWTGFMKVALATIVSYFTLLSIIRIMGKRTLAKMNAYDFVVTITMGSTLSSMLLSKVPLLEGIVALTVLIVLQYLVAFLGQRSKVFERVVNATPTIVFYNGSFIDAALKKERLTEDEVLAEIRSFRIESLDSVRAVVMEINGTFSVIKKDGEPSRSSLDRLI